MALLIDCSGFLIRGDPKPGEPAEEAPDDWTFPKHFWRSHFVHSCDSQVKKPKRFWASEMSSKLLNVLVRLGAGCQWRCLYGSIDCTKLETASLWKNLPVSLSIIEVWWCYLWIRWKEHLDAGLTCPLCDLKPYHKRLQSRQSFKLSGAVISFHATFANRISQQLFAVSFNTVDLFWAFYGVLSEPFFLHYSGHFVECYSCVTWLRPCVKPKRVGMKLLCPCVLTSWRFGGGQPWQQWSPSESKMRCLGTSRCADDALCLHSLKISWHKGKRVFSEIFRHGSEHSEVLDM